MALEDVAPLLEKDFALLKIDQDRTRGGKEMLERFRGGAGGGIPWFVFLHGDGTPIVDSTGPKGNVGCPYQDEEIAWFGEMLEKARVWITPEEIDLLKRTLVRQREEDEKKKKAR
jgi:hypothetical protein